MIHDHLCFFHQYFEIFLHRYFWHLNQQIPTLSTLVCPNLFILAFCLAYFDYFLSINWPDMPTTSCILSFEGNNYPLLNLSLLIWKTSISHFCLCIGNDPYSYYQASNLSLLFPLIVLWFLNYFGRSFVASDLKIIFYLIEPGLIHQFLVFYVTLR